MSAAQFLPYLLVMGGVTYLLRMLPFTLIRKKINNRFFRSFLYYVPYAVLGAMTIPAVFTSTSMAASAAVGFAVAVILAWMEKDMVTVAIAACAAVFLVERLL